MRGLNPCCSGQWSSTVLSLGDNVQLNAVLILVVVDNDLVRDADISSYYC